MDISEMLLAKALMQRDPNVIEIIATECSERHAALNCGGDTCNICRYNPEHYVGPTRGRAIQIAADRQHDGLRQAMIILLVVTLFLVGSMLFGALGGMMPVRRVQRLEYIVPSNYEEQEQEPTYV